MAMADLQRQRQKNERILRDLGEVNAESLRKQAGRFVTEELTEQTARFELVKAIYTVGSAIVARLDAIENTVSMAR